MSHAKNAYRELRLNIAFRVATRHFRAYIPSEIDEYRFQPPCWTKAELVSALFLPVRTQQSLTLCDGLRPVRSKSKNLSFRRQIGVEKPIVRKG